MEKKKIIINVLIIIVSLVSAVLTIVSALGIVNQMISSGLGIIQNPISLLLCLLVGGAVTLFLLAIIKKVFAKIGAYYVGILLSVACFYYAYGAFTLNIGVEYVLTYAMLGALLIVMTVFIAKVFK